ncbi:hypothetical protein ABT024_27775 [Streptomyces sp. NPDC002812]|uniref:hypothetical protein n=1 Tax=Streptomyces sp. NPDC002812 TaxID=3154434 RepID=UPI003330DB67
MTTGSPAQRPDEAALEFLRSAFEPEWREPALGYEAVAEWEAERLISDVGAYPCPGPESSGFLDWIQRWQTGDGWWD